MELEVANVKILKVSLGYHFSDIFSFLITVEADDVKEAEIGYGYFLYDYDPDTDTGCKNNSLKCIQKILEVVGVQNWEDLKGQYCRVAYSGYIENTYAIGNIIKDSWFDIKRFFNGEEEYDSINENEEEELDSMDENEEEE